MCSENKGADQLRGYREADLRLCFRICKKKRFSHDAAQLIGRKSCYMFGIILNISPSNYILWVRTTFEGVCMLENLINIIRLMLRLRLTYLSRVMRKQTFCFPTWSDTNHGVQLQKMARCLKFRI